MSSTDYTALANTIKIEDITSNELNREILHKLKNNDESFDKLYFMSMDDTSDEQDNDDYIPDEGEDMGWLGYYIGQNTMLQEINFYKAIGNESFYKEMSDNKSINKIFFYAADLFNGWLFRMVSPFFKNNYNLTQIEVDECDLQVEDNRQLSLAIGGCNKSLKRVLITRNEMENRNCVDIITALSIHPQLEELDLTWMDIGINECTALSTLLRCTTTQLQKLYLHGNNIDDEGVGLLLPALCGHTIQELKLGNNRSITIKGWKKVSTLLEIPGSKLETLNISNNNMGNDGALVFANALKNNSTLKTLLLSGSGITSEGWAPFSKLLCDISSVNKTYLSNHTLETIHGMPRGHDSDINANLGVNRGNSGDKEFIAMGKILHVHNHFNMQPFFEWEFKVLPLMIDWFEKADSFNYNIVEEKTKRMKLAAVYDFIKEFPMLYVEPMTRKEISEYNAMEEEIQEQLKEIRQRKAHAMRRL